jgi:hypothetical protein
MKKNEFSTVHLNHLSNEDLASLIVQTCDHAIPVKSYIGDMAKIVLEDLIPKASTFSAQVKGQKKSQYTVLVNANRDVSKDLFSEINRTIDFESKSRDDKKKLAAQNFDFFFAPYADLARRAIGTQMEQTQKMLEKYKAAPELIAAAKTIGVDTLLTELEADNKVLVNIYQTRTTDLGNRETSSTELRPEVTAGYIQLTEIIEQTANLMPNDTLLTLFGTLDELRKKHNALASKNKDKVTTPVAE